MADKPEIIEFQVFVKIPKPATVEEIDSLVKRAGSAMYATFGEKAEIFSGVAFKTPDAPKPPVEEKKRSGHLSLVTANDSPNTQGG